MHKMHAFSLSHTHLVLPFVHTVHAAQKTPPHKYSSC